MKRYILMNDEVNASGCIFFDGKEYDPLTNAEVLDLLNKYDELRKDYDDLLIGWTDYINESISR